MAHYDRTLHPCLIYRLRKRVHTDVIDQLKPFCHTINYSTDYTYHTSTVRLNGVRDLRHKIFIDLILCEYCE